MATIKYTLQKDQVPTDEQLAEINTAATQPIVFDDDSAELTAEQIATFTQLATQQRKKQKLA